MKQTNATHRFVHPTLNFWPKLDTQHHPTTQLPHLNWTVGKVSTIIEEVRVQFAGTDITPQTDIEVLKVSHSGKKVLVKYQQFNQNQTSTPNPPREDTFDYVICCTGFADEGEITGIECESYWNQSGETMHSLHRKPSFSRKVGISGLGDGALLDALHALYLPPSSPHVDRRSVFKFFNEPGAIILECFAEVKNQKEVRELILEAEKQREVAKTYSGTDKNKQIAIHEQKVIKAYEKAARKLNTGEIGKILKVLYRGYHKTENEVRLYGLSKSHPCLGEASPFHKLLVTNAYLKGHITYAELDKKLW